MADFDWSKVSTVGPIFDGKKLDWLNGVYIRSLSADELAGRIIAYALESGQWAELPPAADRIVRAAAPLISERLVTLAEAIPKLGFLFTADADLSHNPAAVARLPAEGPRVLDRAVAVLAEPGEWTAEAIEQGLS